MNRELTRNLYKWEIDTWKEGHHYYSSEKDRDHSEIPLHTKMAKIKKKNYYQVLVEFSDTAVKV